MKRVAYLTSRDMVPGAVGARDDLFELQLQLDAIQPACRDAGLALELRIWDDPSLLWSVENGLYDAVVVGTTWDYHQRAPVFFATLDRLGAHVPVCNPPGMVRWNGNKRYLAQLAGAGVPVVPTLWVDRVDAAAAARAHAHFDAARLVAKPVVGAGAVRQVVLEAGAPLPPVAERPPGAAMIQPFLPSVQSEGELSFLFFGGRYSHAVRKLPLAGDYRVQSIYGASELDYLPRQGECELARAVLAAVPGVAPAALLQARVDLVRHPDGALRVMELELIEPYLYPVQGPGMGARFARALAGLLGA